MHVEDKVIKILTFNVALFKRHDLMTRYTCVTCKDQGCVKFRLVCKWKTTFWFVQLEISWSRGMSEKVVLRRFAVGNFPMEM